MIELGQDNPDDYKTTVLSLNYDGSIGLGAAIDAITDQAEQAVRDGSVIVMLTDRDITSDSLPIHSLLATGAVHHRLIKSGLRCNANIVVETATARDPHHFAVLLGYGATAIYPYLAYACLNDLIHTKEIRVGAILMCALTIGKASTKAYIKSHQKWVFLRLRVIAAPNFMRLSV